MSETNNNIIVLVASDGMVLTNGEAYSSVGGKVYLGPNDSAENWHEITKNEYLQYLADKDVAEGLAI